jgi:type VI protein secretion system component VasF
MTAPSADGARADEAPDSRPGAGSVADATDGVEQAREEFAATLDAIEEKFDLTHRWREISARVRTRVAEQPVPVVAVAIAGTAVAALAVFLVIRSRAR